MMGLKNSGIWILSLFLSWSCKKESGQGNQQGNPKPFFIFNSMQYQNMPDLSGRGFHPIQLINETSIFTSTTVKTPDTAKIRTLALQSSTQPSIPVVLDIEAWSYSNLLLDSTIGMFLAVIKTFKQYDSGPMGFYGVVPNDAYSWGNIEPLGSAHYIAWQELNGELSPVADQIELFFPSFYTDDNDTVSWNSFVTSTLSELKKYHGSKPVYAFLWPQYHDGTPNQYQYLDSLVWRYELETLYPLVDGVVIWSSSKTLPGVSSVWNESWPWWQVTQEFIEEHRIH
jgi:hypothetical protein